MGIEISNMVFLANQSMDVNSKNNMLHKKKSFLSGIFSKIVFSLCGWIMFSSYRRFSDAARLSFKHGIFAQIHGIFCWNNAIPHPPKWQVQFSKTYDCGASKVGAHDAATVLLLLPKTIVARCAWPHRGRSFQWEHCRYEKSMAYKNVCEIQKQWKIEVVRRSNEWANGCWDVNEMKWTYWRDRINARMTQWVREWLREWKNDWMWERTNEQTNKRTNELTMNGQINEQMA